MADKFDPNSVHSMLYWIANNASDDPSWRDGEEWEAVDKWRKQQFYGAYVNAIDQFPSDMMVPNKHSIDAVIRRVELWYMKYVVPLQERD